MVIPQKIQNQKNNKLYWIYNRTQYTIKKMANIAINNLINAYNLLIGGIDATANDDTSDRAYGGIIRAGKGLLVESISKEMIRIAWAEIGGEANRISLQKEKVNIPLNQSYLNKIKNTAIVEWIKNNIQDFIFQAQVDIHVYIDGELKMGVECKAYAENAMMKRILVDFTLLKQIYPNLTCVLLQLESQLGGDYSKLSNDIIFGSRSTHTLISHFDVDLNIITLLEGERKVDKAIHKKEHFKELDEINLLKALEILKLLLTDYL